MQMLQKKKKKVIRKAHSVACAWIHLRNDQGEKSQKGFFFFFFFLIKRMHNHSIFYTSCWICDKTDK